MQRVCKLDFGCKPPRLTDGNIDKPLWLEKSRQGRRKTLHAISTETRWMHSACFMSLASSGLSRFPCRLARGSVPEAYLSCAEPRTLPHALSKPRWSPALKFATCHWHAHEATSHIKELLWGFYRVTQETSLSLIFISLKSVYNSALEISSDAVCQGIRKLY